MALRVKEHHAFGDRIKSIEQLLERALENIAAGAPNPQRIRPEKRSRLLTNGTHSHTLYS